MKRLGALAVVLCLLAACTTQQEPASPTPDAASSSVEAAALTSDLGKAVKVTVTLRGAEGEAVTKADHAVAFYASAGTLGAAGKVAPAASAAGASMVILSDANGQASVFINSTVDGVVTVTAHLGDDSSSEEIGSVDVTFGDGGTAPGDEDPGDGDPGDEDPDDDGSPAPHIKNSELWASATRTATGATESVTVQLNDRYGDPLPLAGEPVTFTTDLGQLSMDGTEFGAAGDALSVVTDDDGRATIFVSSAVDAAVHVSGHLGADDSAPELGQVTITFASVILDDLTVTYDGQPHALEATFSAVAAGEGATYTYLRQADEVVLDQAPSDAGVYTVTVTSGGGFPVSASATLTIEPRELAFDAEVVFADRAYDGSSVAGFEHVALAPADIVDGDAVALAEPATGQFQAFDGSEWVPSAVVGDYLNDGATRVVGTLALTGADAHNYVFTQPVGAAAIAPLELTFAAGVAAADKEYDGTVEAVVTGDLQPAPVLGDDIGFVARFAAPNAGSDLPVTVQLTGADVDNYALVAPALTAAITPRPLTITADDRQKVYGDELLLGDSQFTVEGLVEGEGIDSVKLGSAGAAADADAGSYEIGADLALAAEGTSLDNYEVTYVAGTLTVSPRLLTITPDSDQGKTYGEADPELGYTSMGLMPMDVLTGSLGRAAGENAGSYAFTLGDLVVDDGNGGSNYSLALAEDLPQFTIQPRALVVTPEPGQSKTYGDEDYVFRNTVTWGPLVGDDMITGKLGREPGEDVGAYAFTLGTFSVADGNDGANYTITLGASDPFTIVARTVTIGGSMVIADRPYDGTANAQVESNDLELLNAVEGDDVSVAPVVTFQDAHVGTDKLVTLTAATTLQGDAAGNYLLDMTGAPTATADIVKASVAFDITNDELTYTGAAQGIVVVSDPAPVPADEPVIYTVKWKRVLTPSGEQIEEGVAGILDAGQYRVTLTANDPRYTGSNDVIVTVGARPITLTTDVTGKVYGEADPELPPRLAGGTTLGAGDALSGLLTFTGVAAGTYDLDLGSVVIKNGRDEDVTENYAISLAGSFTIQPAPVSFDISNADFTIDGVHVYERDGDTIVGLTIVADPAGMTDYVLSYRRTHDGSYQPIPAGQQTVSTIEALGTYVVTIASTSPNYAGISDRTVWVTDGFDLVGALPSEEEGELPSYVLPVNWPSTGRIPLQTSGGDPLSLGPVPVTFDLTVEPATGLRFLDPETLEPITSVTVEPGATLVEIPMETNALSMEPYTVTVTPSGPLAGLFTGVSFQIVPAAEIVIVGGGIEVGEDANSPIISVQLRDENGAPVEAPADIALTLQGDAGLAFVAAGSDDLVGGVVIPAGSTSANFRVRSAAAGEYEFYVEYGAKIPALNRSLYEKVTVNPKPTVSSVSPNEIQVGETSQFFIDGTDFVPGATVSLGGGLTVGDVTVDSASRITVEVTATLGEVDLGAAAVTVTNPDGGMGTLDAGFTVVKPTVTASDDQANIVEGGSIDLPVTTLLANDFASTGLRLTLVAVADQQNVTVVDNGSTLRVTSSGLMGQVASFDYTVEDPLGTQATATVTFNVTLPPQDAVVFTARADLEAYTAGYEPPTFQEVFDTWPRASNGNYYPDPSQEMGGNADDWFIDPVTGSIVQPQNTSPHEIIVSPEADALEYYEFEATLTSNNADDDAIGLVIAFTRDAGGNKYLVALRTQGNNGSHKGWGIAYVENGTITYLTNVQVGATSAAWSNRQSRVRIVRNGDLVTAWASYWGDLSNYGGEMVIDLDANTINGAVVGKDLSVFKGEKQYGYYTQSQPYSTYLDIVLTGGLARDLAYLLTNGTDSDATPGDDTWTGSEVWKFNAETLLWEQQLGQTIQDDLRFPRVVTSVAPVDPSDPDSPVVGTRFEVRENEVVLLPDLP